MSAFTHAHTYKYKQCLKASSSKGKHTSALHVTDKATGEGERILFLFGLGDHLHLLFYFAVIEFLLS